MTTATLTNVGAPEDRLDRGKLAVFALMTLGMFMAILDIQIVAASLPEIQAGLSASADQISWVQTSYLIAEVMMIPISGYLGRALSTRVLFTLSAGGFTLASIGCGFAWSLESLIVMRAVQGFLGGAMIPLVFSTSITAFPRSRAMQLSAGMGLIVTMAPTVGPTLGGAISEYLSWHWLFFVNVVPGAIITSVVWLYADFDKPDMALLKKFDASGFVLLALALGLTQYILEEAPDEDWFESGLISTMAAVALAAGAAFFMRMRGRAAPLVDFNVYRNPNFTAGSLVAASMGIALFGLVYLLPLYLARVRGFNSLQIGETLLVTGAAMFLAAPVAAIASRRFDPRLVSGAGLVLVGASTHALTYLTADWTYWELFWPQVGRGFGLMMTMAPLNVIALGTLEPSKVGGASGLYNLSRNLGGAFGLAMINTFLTERTDYHARVLADHFDSSRAVVVERVTGLTDYYAAMGHPDASAAAIATLSGIVNREATVLAFSDAFQAITLACLVTVPLLIIASPPKAGAQPGGH